MNRLRTRTHARDAPLPPGIDQPDGTPRAFAMGVRERVEPLDSPLYIRGELDQPGEVVPRGLVQLCRLDDASATDRQRAAAGASWRTGSPRPPTR